LGAVRAMASGLGSGTTLSSRFPGAQSLVLELHSQLERLESGVDTSEQLELDILQNVNTLTKEIQILENLAHLEGSRKFMWKKRISQLSDECVACRQSIERYSKRHHEKRREEEIRHELFASQSVGTPSETSKFMNRVQVLGNEKESVMSSISLVDEMLGMGKHALESLSSQQIRMKNIQKAVRNIANSLGLSNSLLRVISRTERSTAYLTYGCMVLTIIIIALLYYYKFIFVLKAANSDADMNQPT